MKPYREAFEQAKAEAWEELSSAVRKARAACEARIVGVWPDPLVAAGATLHFRDQAAVATHRLAIEPTRQALVATGIAGRDDFLKAKERILKDHYRL